MVKQSSKRLQMLKTHKFLVKKCIFCPSFAYVTFTITLEFFYAGGTVKRGNRVYNLVMHYLCDNSPRNLQILTGCSDFHSVCLFVVCNAFLAPSPHEISEPLKI